MLLYAFVSLLFVFASLLLVCLHLPTSLLFPLDVQLFLFYICFSFQLSIFISVLCLRLFPSDSMQTQWVTLMFSHNLTGGQGPG